jgi:hypothetical protein
MVTNRPDSIGVVNRFISWHLWQINLLNVQLLNSMLSLFKFIHFSVSDSNYFFLMTFVMTSSARLIMNRDRTVPGDHGDAEDPKEQPEANVPRKGSLLTTLTDIVSKHIQSQGSTTVERQQGSLTSEQELTN